MRLLFQPPPYLLYLLLLPKPPDQLLLSVLPHFQKQSGWSLPPVLLYFPKRSVPPPMKHFQPKHFVPHLRLPSMRLPQLPLCQQYRR